MLLIVLLHSLRIIIAHLVVLLHTFFEHVSGPVQVGFDPLGFYVQQSADFVVAQTQIVLQDKHLFVLLRNPVQQFLYPQAFSFRK